MGIQYAGGVNRNDLYTLILTPRDLCTAIAATLGAAGWTSVGVNPWALWMWTGQPNDSQTITIDDVVYTAKLIINNAFANQFLIDTDADQTYRNFKDCLNNNPATSGTKFSSATTANPTFFGGKVFPFDSFISGGTYPAPCGMLRVQDKNTGWGGMGAKSVSTTCVNGLWSTAANGGGSKIPFYSGFWLKSAETPDHRVCMLRVYDGSENQLTSSNPSDRCRLVLSDACELGNEIVQSHFQEPAAGQFNTMFSGYALQPGLGMNWRVIANKYQFFVYLDGVDGATAYSWACGGVPALITFSQKSMAAKPITNATNATPIVISCVTHGYVTNDNVCIRNVTGNLAANGNWVITKVNDDSFSLNGSIGSEAYAGGGYVGKINLQLSESMFLAGSSGNKNFIRGDFQSAGYWWQSLDGETMGGRDVFINGNSSGAPAILTEMESGAGGRLANPLHFYNQSVMDITPLIASGIAEVSQIYVWGQLWDAQLVHHSMNRDAINLAGLIDGHNWKALTAENAGSTNSRQASLIHVIP